MAIIKIIIIVFIVLCSLHCRDATNMIGLYQVPSAGGAPRLVVRFDAQRVRLQGGGPSAVGNGMACFVLVELESDIHVMDLVWK